MSKGTGALPDTSPFGTLPAGRAERLAWRLATARSFAPATRWRLRKLVATRYPGPYDVSVEGMRIRAYPAENYCDRVAVGRSRLPEEPERAMIAPMLFPGMVFIDIGANVGVYSLFVSYKTGGRAKVIAFEPHPRSFGKLEFNRAANGFGNIACVNAAVGPSDGDATLFADGGNNAGGASLLKEAGVGRSMTAVRVVPLAAALETRDVGRVDLLKIDVEGFEDEALLPFFRSAHPRLWPQHILLETARSSFWKEDLGGFLAGAGYHVSGSTMENQLFTRDS